MFARETPQPSSAGEGRQATRPYNSGIAAADSSGSFLTRSPRLARGAALVVLLLASSGQLVLERARLANAPLPILGALALVGAAILAVIALGRSDLLPGPPEMFELRRFPRALYAWCLPGGIALIAALIVHLARPGSPRAAALWFAGIALVLLPGVADLVRRMRHRSPEAARATRRFLAAGAILFVFALAVRTVGGIGRFPGFIDSDEAATAIAVRSVVAEGPRALFGFSDTGSTARSGLVSIPRVAFFVLELAAAPFGQKLEGLRMGSAVLGSLTVVLLFDFARRLVGNGTAFLAALLLSVNHAFVHYTRVGQIYVEAPFFASLALALLIRAMTGGSFLALTAVGIALGIGVATHLSAVILPAVIAAVVAGWAVINRWRSSQTLATLGFIGIVFALTCAPVIATALQMTLEIAYQRVPAISLLRPDGFGQLQSAYGAGSVPEAIREHVLRTISLFNFGSDSFKAYGANRALNEPLTAALVPVAFALLLARLSTPVGWLCVVFTGAYFCGGVLLCSGPPTYHRVLVLLLFSSLAVAWTATGLARTLAARVKRPRWLPAAAAVAFVGASAWLNLHYYFAENSRVRLLDAGSGLGSLICRYATTHTVIDATSLDGREYVPTESFYPDLQCPGGRRIVVRESARLWRTSESTTAPRIVLIVPEAVELPGPGAPRGYHLVRRTVDESIESPARVRLSVLEFERSP